MANALCSTRVGSRFPYLYDTNNKLTVGKCKVIWSAITMRLT